MSEVKKGYNSTKQYNQFRVTKHIPGVETQVVSKAVYCPDQRSVLLYVLDLELDIYSKEEKEEKFLEYWEDLFKLVIEYVNFNMDYDKEKPREKWPIGKKDVGKVLACNKRVQRR
jgi:hypothetical protein